ncbi:hypothetical protein HNR60_001594 [Rhodopseudomonas rhenobacensis]|uniref:Uncharacterized protein n=1 Tax=Rhodopseudomonas rhenobacensis TaxID=87461 RepID=A0A7W7Z302_9BRAD|nr:hypothetical protein [Rhodopseudomonas rhenobacensis]MBB5046845.1 hypothetical protein [Rhodopseudomonas rhenobacensis]
MSDNFVEALDAEIAELEADIAARPDVRVVKLADLRSIRQRFYTSSNTTHHVSGAFAIQTVLGHARAVGRRRAPETEAALNAARELLAGRSTPTRTSDIFDHLRQRGISVPGNDPPSNLSAMLSKARNFVSHGRSGWTLADDDGPPAPPDPVAPPPGPHSDDSETQLEDGI